MIKNHNNKLKNPYRPLKSLDKQDRNILVGREHGIDEFMSALWSPKTRVLILNGEPGVGKSSFLQAELIPKLESSNFPFRRFNLIDFKGENIIFCGADPIESIVSAIFNSKWKEQILEISRKIKDKKGIISTLFEKIKQIKSDYKPEGEIWRELSIIFESSDFEKFKSFLSKKDGLSDFLCLFSFYSPCTKILIFDHIEQIFNYSEIKNAKEFLEGIRYFSKYDCDAKIILSIRADYLAKLRSVIYSPLFPDNIRDIYLNDIEDEKYLIKAIRKPCSNIGCYFADESFPEEIVREIQKKKIHNVSILPILHIIGYRLFDNMIKRAEKEGVGNEIDKKKDFIAGNSEENKYVQIIASFLMERIRNICKNETDGSKFHEEDIKELLYRLVDFSTKRMKFIEKYSFIENAKKELNFNSEKTERIISILENSRIVVQTESRIIYLILSNDLFAEAIVFLTDKSAQLEKTGLTDVFENKRDPGIEKSMANILSEFRENRTRVGQLMLASVVGKQFFHKNDKLYKEMNSLLETLKKEGVAKPVVKVIIAKPYSKLFLCRAESELPYESVQYSHNEIHHEAFDWKENRLFIDSLITIGRLQFLTERYKNIIDVRLSGFMPLSILSSGDHAIFNPYTFAADGKINEKESWCGALPIYHHKNKKSYQLELKNHFNYIWNKGVTLDEFDSFLQETDVFINHKIEFFNRKQKNMRMNHEFV